VQYNRQASRLPANTFTQLEAAAAPARHAGLRVEFGGAVTDLFNTVSGGNADVIGLAVAVVILLLAFGSVIAMSLPIGTALCGLAVGLSLIYLLASVTNVGTVAADARHDDRLRRRDRLLAVHPHPPPPELVAGMDVLDSIGLANGTAGQAVLFAGGTVVIALSGLTLADVPYVTVLGLTSHWSCW